jgi:DNA gyrase subunit A
MSDSISNINIEDELRNSYLDYAMSVIVGRALPDVRDGLKPVHRRVLFAMSENNNAWNRPHMKSARIVGDVIGKYHPHGDQAAYEAMVRMAQSFSMRYPLVDGQGNFGSLDGDNPAAQRYTEVRMAKIAHELLADLDKETVDFVDNYDASMTMPEVLPAKIPNLLVNGSNGIAVGMATNIPPHNLREVIDGCLALIEDPELDVDGLMAHIQGPDFPTGAIINGRAGIVSAYRTGRGRILVRAKTSIESDEKSSKDRIIVHEIPYQLNRARLIERIAELVKEKRIEGITELRDESSTDTRIVMELRRGEIADVVLNNLFAHTQLQSVYGINMVALVRGEPKTLNLKEILAHFIQHRREVVIRRTVYLLRRARTQGHVLEGLAVALSNIDPVIELIRDSSSSQEARERLMAQDWESDSLLKMLERAGPNAARPDDLADEYGLQESGGYRLSEEQARAILDMRLNRLTGLEQERLIDDYKGVIETITALMDILGRPERLTEIVVEELAAMREEYGDDRLTEIVSTQEDLTAEDLITEQDMVVTLSNGGYAKTQPLDAYQAQRRGGRGKAASTVKEEDFIERLMVANTHDTILCFTNMGKVYWLRVFQIPVASRTARGRPVVNILPLDEGERITAMLPVHEYREDEFIFMATTNGTVKKTPLMHFSRRRTSGLIAIELEEGNTLIGASITDGTRDVMLCSSGGKVIRFKESDVRATGRTARGVRGIRLQGDQRVMSLIIPQGGQILVGSANGYGKKMNLDEFSVIGRGGQGVIGMKLSDRNGDMVGAIEVFEGDEVFLISDQGTLIRTRCDEISHQGRNTQGVRLINVIDGEALVGIARVDEPEGSDEDGDTDAVAENAEAAAPLDADSDSGAGPVRDDSQDQSRDQDGAGRDEGEAPQDS